MCIRDRSDTRHQLCHLLSVSDVSRQRLLARNAFERRTVFHRAHNLFNVVDARLIGTAEPDCVDRWIGYELGNCLVPASITDLEISRKLRSGFGVLRVGTPHTPDIRVANGRECLDVEAGVESAPDESDSNCHLVRCTGTRVFIRSCETPSLSIADWGQPFHAGSATLPTKFTSLYPISLEKNPLAVRSRKRLKNATPWLSSAFAFFGHAMSSRIC